MARTAEFYKDVYSLPSDERPDDDTIQDDHKLDVYLDDLMRRRAQASMR